MNRVTLGADRSGPRVAAQTVMALGLNATINVARGANAQATIFVADPNSTINFSDVSTNFTFHENGHGNVDFLTDTATGQTFQIHGKVNLVFGDGVTMVVNPTDPSSFDHFADIVGSIDNAHAATALSHHLVG